MLIKDLSSNQQSRKQIFLILLDFSKSFDKVKHMKHVAQSVRALV